ncbi:MAG: prolyl oligopeptidase family serine peptidase [Polyangiaceae bacterium]|nr:prolyl oligopeptidase family serine peptidase [Polyangiaceae bacterium]
MQHIYRSFAIASTTFVLTMGCSSSSGDSSQSSSSGGENVDETLDFVVGGDRPVTVHVPPGLDPAKPAPLVILLHGFGASGFVQELVFRLEPESDARGFLYAHPDGTVDADGKRFWNATDACCDFGNTMVDDAAYLAGLVKEIGEHHAVDPKRVFFTGHSNGGFMSHRLACDKPDIIAAVASLAGSTYLDPAKCTAAEPVSVLQIHGTKDDSVLYEGEAQGGVGYPSAMETTAIWAAKNGCDAVPQEAAPIDIDAVLDGAETLVTRHANCKPGGAAELWTMQNATHIPGMGPNFAPTLVDWLFAHAKP